MNTILTMGLSCVLFIIIANVAGNMDARKQTRENFEYGKYRIDLETALNDVTYPENNRKKLSRFRMTRSFL